MSHLRRVLSDDSPINFRPLDDKRYPICYDTTIPAIHHYFRSYYYPNTYLPPVDLRKSILEFSCPYPNIIPQAQKVAELPGVQKILSETFSYDAEVIKRNNSVLQENGFTILGSKPLNAKPYPFYNVCEHRNLSGWIIKAAGQRFLSIHLGLGQLNDHNEGCFMHPNESLLRLAMHKRISEVAGELSLPFDLPEEYAVPFKSKSHTNDLSRSYFIISKKISDLLSLEDTIAALALKPPEEQEELADKLSLLIKKVGLPDATLNNIRLTARGTWVVLDTEPTGLLIPKEGKDLRSHSVEKCARVGLCTLYHSTYNYPELNAFTKRVHKNYTASLQEISIIKIALSILIPVIPLVLIIISWINIQAIKSIFKEIEINYINPDLRKVDIALKQRYFQLIEGVPFPMFKKGQLKINEMFLESRQ